MKTFWLLSLCLALGATGARAASFACAQAHTLVEHAICDNPDLSSADDRLTEFYRAVRAADAGIVLSQRAWLAERNSCQTVACVRSVYERRIAELSTTSAPAGWSPAGHYAHFQKGGPPGEMMVRKEGDGWRVMLDAGGIPNGDNTAADCALVATGRLVGRTFQGEIRFEPDADKWDQPPTADDAAEPGHALTVRFDGPVATVEAQTSGLCGNGDGASGLYRRTAQ